MKGLRGRAQWLAPPFLVGAGARLWGLRHQIFLSDEVHGLEVALAAPLRQVFIYRPKDHCMPLAGLYRLLAWLGVELSESVLRAPSVVAGLLALLVLPLLAARWGGARVGALLAWLLAISPSLVYYSRIARPYVLVVLFGGVAVAAFWRWYRGGGWGFAAGYAVAAALAIWLHPGAAPFVGAPFAFAALETLWRVAVRRQPGRRSPAALALVAAGAGAGVALFLVPAWSSLVRILRLRAGQESLTGELLGDVLLLQAGSARPWIAILFWVTALGGLGLLARRRPAAAAYTLVLVAVHWAAVTLVLEPFKMSRTIVLGRYLLVALPVALLWAAWGLAEVWDRVGKRRGLLGPVIPAAFLAALALAGPYVADPWLGFGPFAGSHAAAGFHEGPAFLPEERVPGIYRFLDREPDRGSVVEAPATTVSQHLDALIALSRIHGRPVILGTRRVWLSDPRVAFETLIEDRPEPLCRAPSRFLVFHRNRPHLEVTVDLVREGHPPPPPRRGPFHPGPEELARDLTGACGEPHLVSDEVLIWDLARLRTRE